MKHKYKSHKSIRKLKNKKHQHHNHSQAFLPAYDNDIQHPRLYLFHNELLQKLSFP